MIDQSKSLHLRWSRIVWYSEELNIWIKIRVSVWESLFWFFIRFAIIAVFISNWLYFSCVLSRAAFSFWRTIMLSCLFLSAISSRYLTRYCLCNLLNIIRFISSYDIHVAITNLSNWALRTRISSIDFLYASWLRFFNFNF